MTEDNANDFLLADEDEPALKLNACPYTLPHQLAPHLWADRMSPLYQQFRVYSAGEYRGSIFQETPATRTWSAERMLTGETVTDLPSRSAAVNWLVPEHTTKARPAVSRQPRTPKEGASMTGYQKFEPADFAEGTRLTLTTKDGVTHSGLVQADGQFIDDGGATYRSATNWHKKLTGRYGRSWTVEAPATTAKAAKPKAAAKARKATTDEPVVSEPVEEAA